MGPTLDADPTREQVRDLVLLGVIMENETDRMIKLRIAEYNAAQDSAQHHDNLLWYVSSIVWGGNLVLLGSVVENMGNTGGPLPRRLVVCVGIFCILLNLCLWACSCLFRDIRTQKYERCRFIENRLGFYQHTTLRYPRGLMWSIYSLVMIMFLFLWFLVVFLVC